MRARRAQAQAAHLSCRPGLAGAGGRGSLRPRCPARRWHRDGPALPAAAAAANLNEAAGHASDIEGSGAGRALGTAAPRRPSPGWRASVGFASLPVPPAPATCGSVMTLVSPAGASAAQPIRAACQARGSGSWAFSQRIVPHTGRELDDHCNCSINCLWGFPVAPDRPHIPFPGLIPIYAAQPPLQAIRRHLPQRRCAQRHRQAGRRSPLQARRQPQAVALYRQSPALQLWVCQSRRSQTAARATVLRRQNPAGPSPPAPSSVAAAWRRWRAGPRRGTTGPMRRATRPVALLADGACKHDG